MFLSQNLQKDCRKRVSSLVLKKDINTLCRKNVTSSWTGHANVDLVFTNTGSETIHNWILLSVRLTQLTIYGNASIAEMDGAGTYTIVNSTWNQDIVAGQSVTVGFTFSDEEEISTMPEWYLLNTREAVVDPSDYSLTYQEQSSWDGGFTGALILQTIGTTQRLEGHIQRK
jgi:hypothetical protein